MEKISLLCFILQFYPLCNCHIRKTELANLHVSSSWSWNWGFPWDNEEEILGVLYTAIDAPAKSAVLPCSNNFMSVPSCSSVSCHPATLEPHLLLNVCINQFCVWCSLSAGQSRRLHMGTEHVICLIYLHQSHFLLHGKLGVLHPCSLPFPHKSVCFLPDEKSWNN